MSMAREYEQRQRRLMAVIVFLVVLLACGVVGLLVSQVKTGAAVLGAAPIPLPAPTSNHDKQASGRIALVEVASDRRVMSGSVTLGVTDSRNDTGSAQVIDDAVVYLDWVSLTSITPPSRSELPKPVAFDLVPGGFSTPHLLVFHGQQIRVTQRAGAMNRNLRIHQNGKTIRHQAFPKAGISSTFTIQQPGTFMSADDGIFAVTPSWIHVFNHSYYALSDANGLFSIERPPMGTYKLVCEHAVYGRLERELELDGGENTVLIKVEYDDSAFEIP